MLGFYSPYRKNQTKPDDPCVVPCVVPLPPPKRVIKSEPTSLPDKPQVPGAYSSLPLTAVVRVCSQRTERTPCATAATPAGKAAAGDRMDWPGSSTSRELHRLSSAESYVPHFGAELWLPARCRTNPGLSVVPPKPSFTSSSQNVAPGGWAAVAPTFPPPSLACTP